MKRAAVLILLGWLLLSGAAGTFTRAVARIAGEQIAQLEAKP